ncbi:MAG TPA: hypothetical protein VI756_01575, partial [Blastocatellia bacterium]
LRQVSVGSTVSLTVFRQGKLEEISYSVPERPLLPGDIVGPGASMQLTRATTAGSTTAGPPAGRGNFRF